MADDIGPARERIDLIDALRGLAIFGILFANIPDWAGWHDLTKEQAYALAGKRAAESYEFLQTMLVEGKFYTIFSLLFGLGFSLQLSRLESRGVDGLRVYRRRLTILLMIGVIHMTLLWEGDILALYAALGFLLPFMRRWSDRALLFGAALLLFLPIPGLIVQHMLGLPPGLGMFQLSEMIARALGADPENWRLFRAREDWGSYFQWVLSGPPQRIGNLLASWRIPKVLAIMMLGLWAGRRLIARALLNDRRLLKRVMIAGFLIGLPVNFAFAAHGGLDQDRFGDALLAFTYYAVGVVPLGLAYAASFALAWPKAQTILGILAPTGRMALTNYLMHSVLGIIIFYGVGFGMMGKFGPLGICAIALAIFAAQIILSRIWLQHFAQGPMEALWRRLTYAGFSPHDGMRLAR